MPNMLFTTRFMMDARSTAAADHRTEPQDVGMGQQLPTPKAKPQSTKKVNQTEVHQRVRLGLCLFGGSNHLYSICVPFVFHSCSICVPFAYVPVVHEDISTVQTEGLRDLERQSPENPERRMEGGLPLSRATSRCRPKCCRRIQMSGPARIDRAGPSRDHCSGPNECNVRRMPHDQATVSLRRNDER